MRLCLIEDDPTILQLLSERLQRRGYQVDTFDSAEPLLQSNWIWDLYIVDILLRGNSTGLDFCKRLRESDPMVPILILSALDDVAVRLEGLRLGADDYLTKPFEMEELILRVNGMLRRRSWYQKLPGDKNEFCWGQNRIDFLRLQGQRGGSPFSLSQKECMVMKLLVERKGEVVTRDEILDNVWGYNAFPTERTVDNFIVKLRRYFESDPKNPKYIQSIRGLGYRFSPEDFP